MARTPQLPATRLTLLPQALTAFVPQFTDALLDLSARTNAKIKGQVLTRLVQLALRWVFDDQPIERLRTLLTLIEQVRDKDTAPRRRHPDSAQGLQRHYPNSQSRIRSWISRTQCQPKASRTVTERVGRDRRERLSGTNPSFSCLWERLAAATGARRRSRIAERAHSASVSPAGPDAEVIAPASVLTMQAETAKDRGSKDGVTTKDGVTRSIFVACYR